MSLTPSAAYAAKNDLAYKTPMYTVAFQTVAGLTSYTITDVNTAFPLWLQRAISVEKPVWTTNEWTGYTCVVTTRLGEQFTRIVNTNTTDTVTFTQSLPMDAISVGDEFRFDFYENFCTYEPTPDILDSISYRPYVAKISGGGYSISPDEGSTSSATLKIVMQDTNNEVTHMIHSATGNLQKKTCVVKAGYVGLRPSEMLTVFTGEVTDYIYEKDGSWQFSVSDAIRALNKNVFRDASDTDINVVRGNPINILLSLLISDQGDGTKGIYDVLPPGYGLNLPLTKIDIAGFEEIRNSYYPNTAVKFYFEVTDRESANDFIKNEIFKPLNMYPVVLGDGRFSARIYRQPLPPYAPYSITEDDMLEVPTYNGNLTDLINEVQFSYNYDEEESEFLDIVVFADADSINTRGVGDRTLEVECQGIRDEDPDENHLMDADDFLERSAKRIFNRYATPPIKLSVSLMYQYLLIETGDIILVSNKFLPNLQTGDFDLENIPMEVIKRTVDWNRGSVKLELLQTGYEANKYAVISPDLTVDTWLSPTSFSVSDVNYYDEGFYVTHYRPVADFDRSDTRPYEHMEKLQDDLIITNIDGYDITIDGLTNPPAPGDIFVYNDTGTVTEYQDNWGRIGAGYLIAP